MVATTPKRIPSLDGLRAVSVLLVFVAHGGVSAGAPRWMGELHALGNLGVRVFFVISGFLITHLLLKERARTGAIDLGGFYARRAYRILPAAYVYMLVVTGVCWASLSKADLLTSYLYVVNYHSQHAWNLGHLWSLGVEEQFYLLWPLLLATLFAHRRAMLVGALLLCPVFRAGFLFAYSRHLPVPLDGVTAWFPAVADALATGCLLAVVRPSLQRYARILGHPLMLAVPVFTLLLVQVQRLEGRYVGVTYHVLLIPLVHLGIALSLDHCVRRRYALLNAPSVVWCGAISYSLYLWQQPFLLSTYRIAGAVAWWRRFPQNVGLAFAAGVASYYLVEAPILRLREKRMGRVVPPAADSSPAPSRRRAAM